MTITEELDALDRAVAEARGWKWHNHKIVETYGGLAVAPRGLASMPEDFEPTRDDRQAMVLFGELPVGSALSIVEIKQGTSVDNLVPVRYYQCAVLGKGYIEPSWQKAIVRAWLAYKVAS